MINWILDDGLKYGAVEKKGRNYQPINGFSHHSTQAERLYGLVKTYQDEDPYLVKVVFEDIKRSVEEDYGSDYLKWMMGRR